MTRKIQQRHALAEGAACHAPQEAERVLAESIDYARQGQLALRGVKVPGLQTREAVKPVPAQSRQK